MPTSHWEEFYLSKNVLSCLLVFSHIYPQMEVRLLEFLIESWRLD